MRTFDDIIAMAADRHGGRAALEEILASTRPLPPEAIAATPDDRILAAMTRLIFQAGFSWKVIDEKWPAFEAAFDRFDLHRCTFMTEQRFDALTKDASIIRNAAKIRSVPANARFLLELAAEHGSAARFFAHWPDTDYVGLLDMLKKRANRLGGESAMRLLRAIGKPAFVTTTDVVTALIREQVLDKPPTSRRDFAAVQDSFNRWSAESGRDLTAISRILAMSVGASAATYARR